MVEHSMTFANKGGLELLSNEDFPSKALDIAKVVIEKLSSKKIKGKKMPVVLNNGFGAVIFHEACGHGLEAEALKNNLTVFKDDLGKIIASDKVTLIDDPTLNNYYGSNLIDDEGSITKKVILIEKGVLKSFLVDKFNGFKLSLEPTSSSRRENYLYKPTSRMSNTYLLAGKDKIEDMTSDVESNLQSSSSSLSAIKSNQSTIKEFTNKIDEREEELVKQAKVTDEYEQKLTQYSTEHQSILDEAKDLIDKAK